MNQQRGHRKSIKGRHFTVRDSYDFCASVPGKMYCAHGHLRVPGKADSQQHIPGPDAQHLVKDLSRSALHQRHIFKNQMEIKI